MRILYKIKENNTTIKLMKFDMLTNKYNTIYKIDDINKDYYEANFKVIKELGHLMGVELGTMATYRAISVVGINLGILVDILGHKMGEEVGLVNGWIEVDGRRLREIVIEVSR